MRPLTLHASALNDEEYDLYTSSLSDLAWTGDNDTQQPHDDAYYEQMKIGVREMRGWLRGKYSRLSQGSVDMILRYFSSNLSPTDVLTGGQFFAALRLVVHADNGRDVERGLAFVQAHPDEKSLQKLEQSSPKLPAATPALPASCPSTTTTSPSNPFAQPPKSPHTAFNPFAPRPQNESSQKLPPLPPRKPPPIPPQLIPPPKHASILLPPSGRTSPRGSSISTPMHALSHHPPVPPKPAHVTSSLMKQSLQASKVAQSMKRAEEQLDQERVLQVLKSSAVVSGSSSLAGASISRSSIVVGTQVRTSHTRSVSPGKVILHAPQPPGSLGGSERKSRGSVSVSVSSGSGEEMERGRAPPLPRRRNTNTHTQQQPSPPVSVSSLEQVALAQTAVEPTMHKSPPPPPPTRSLTNPFPPSTVNNNNPYHQRTFDSMSQRSSPPRTSPSQRTTELPHPSRPPPTHPDHRKLFPSSSHATTITTTSTTTMATPSSSPFHSSTTPGSTPTTTNSFSTPETSPTARVFRSKSLHHPSPPLSPFHAVLDPPPRRKRPESVQVLRSPGGSVGGDALSVSGGGGGGGFMSRSEAMATTPTTPSPHRRQTSYSASSSTSTPAQPFSFEGVIGGAGTEMSKLAKTWQPRLEKARYKAEAGLSRRGYVRHGHSSVSSRARSKSGSVGSTHGGGGGEEERDDLWGVRASGYEKEEDEYEPPSVDKLSLEDGTASDDERERARRGMERDGLKWPVSESDGWRPL